MKNKLVKTNTLGQLLITLISIIFISTASLYADSHLIVNLENISMKNAAQPFKNIITGGQPSLEDLKSLKAKGVTNIINLRGKTESVNFDELAEDKKMGFNYVSLEIPNASALSIDNAKQLDKLLKDMEGTTLVHCGSSNRVGALFAIKAAAVDGKNHDQAIIEGLNAGLKSLRKKTEAVLETVK